MSEVAGLNIKEKYGVLWIVLPRVISVDNTQDVGEKIFHTLEETQGDVAIDLSNTDYLYSTGINLMIKMKKRLNKASRSVSLVNLSSSIQKELEAVHLDKVFPVYATETEMEISKDLIWEKKLMEESGKFIFISGEENGILILSFSGDMDSLNDLSVFQDFTPDESLKRAVLDMENLEVMDTFGVQLFFEKVRALDKAGYRLSVFGANETVAGLLRIFSDSESSLQIFDSKSEAIDYVKSDV